MKKNTRSLYTYRTALFVVALWTCHTLNGQSRLPLSGRVAGGENTDGSHWAETDEDTTRSQEVPIGLTVWKVEPRFGMVKAATPDTLSHLFPNTSQTEGIRGHYNFTGNLGAPRQSRIYTDRERHDFADPFFFALPYDYFLTQPEDLFYTNTKSPITNITYHECGNKQNGEDRIRGLFATNINSRTGVGFKLDYLYGRGYYDSQSTSQFNGTLWGSYRGERYQIHALYSASHLKGTENGGIEDDDYVLRPETFPTAYGTADMPTRLSRTWNKMYVNTLYLTQRYSFGFRRYYDEAGEVVRTEQMKKGSPLLGKMVSTPGDTLAAERPETVALDTLPPDDEKKLRREFVPVAGILHTLRLDHNNRRFLSNLEQTAVNSDYFKDFYYDDPTADDRTKYLRLHNLLALELREGFNNWVKSGLRLYAAHDYYHYTLPDANRYSQSFVENQVSVGAQLLKEQGHFFHYHVLGELRTSGSDWGEFNVTGDADFNLPLKRKERCDTLTVKLQGDVRHERPGFYFRHYHARNAWWDLSLDKELTARVRGEIAYKQTRLSVGVTSIQNYTYFAEEQSQTADGTALYGVGVRQAGSNVQLLTATLGQDFAWGVLHWENEVTAQTTSDADVLPLPACSVYSNLYLLFRIARVLRTELGGDVRYFTSYYAPTYSPLIGQYAVQDAETRVKVGNYPFVNVYANFHLKNTRFYLMASHVNYSSGKGKPFLVPHYPLNRMVLRFGVSWNFFN